MWWWRQQRKIDAARTERRYRLFYRKTGVSTAVLRISILQWEVRALPDKIRRAKVL